MGVIDCQLVLDLSFFLREFERVINRTRVGVASRHPDACSGEGGTDEGVNEESMRRAHKPRRLSKNAKLHRDGDRGAKRKVGLQSTQGSDDPTPNGRPFQDSEAHIRIEHEKFHF